MVYLIIGFGGLFALFWVLALVFATRTVGERSLGIPGFLDCCIWCHCWFWIV